VWPEKSPSNCFYYETWDGQGIFHLGVMYNFGWKGYAGYHSVQKLLSSPLLSKNVKIKIYKTITLFVVLYGLSLTLAEEHGLKVFANRVLRRMFGPKRDQIIEGCRKMRNGELHNSYLRQT
jgi:hypothetical protein